MIVKLSCNSVCQQLVLPKSEIGQDAEPAVVLTGFLSRIKHIPTEMIPMGVTRIGRKGSSVVGLRGLRRRLWKSQLLGGESRKATAPLLRMRLATRSSCSSALAFRPLSSCPLPLVHLLQTMFTSLEHAHSTSKIIYPPRCSGGAPESSATLGGFLCRATWHPVVCKR
jgi:hypothetical protein